MPITVIAGPDHTRDPRVPVPISGPAVADPPARGTPPRRGRRGPTPRGADPRPPRRPRRRAARRGARSSTSRASGAAPPYWPLCRADGERRDLDVTFAMPRSRQSASGCPAARCRCRRPSGRRRRTAGVGRGVRRQRRTADLLGPSITIVRPPGAARSRRAARRRARRCSTWCRRCRGRIRAVAHGRLERRGGPPDSSPGGHDVVVAVEQHGRRALGAGDLARSRSGWCRGGRACETPGTPASRKSCATRSWASRAGRRPSPEIDGCAPARRDRPAQLGHQRADARGVL